MPDVAQLKKDCDRDENNADRASFRADTNPGPANFNAEVKAWRTAVKSAEDLNGFTDKDWCRLAYAYEKLAKALRRQVGVNDQVQALEAKAADAYRKCAIQHLAGAPGAKPRVPADPTRAAEAFRKCSQALRRRAEGLTDSCEMGDEYYAAAEVLLAAAAADPSAADAIDDIGHAAALFRQAAECYERCGDAAMGSDPLHAHEAYHKAVVSYGDAERCEGEVEGYYKKREPPEDPPRPGHGPATAHGRAEKRRKEDAEHRRDAARREQEAREEYLEGR
jgi:hypothetical protein